MGKNPGFMPGRPTLLSYFEEKTLVEIVIQLSDFGFPIDNTAIKLIAANYCNEINKSNLFKGGHPSQDWIESFQKRWHHLIGILN